MSSRRPSPMRWTGHKKMDELLDDPIAESLYGLFLQVKDSPRHISIKPEKLINEVFFIRSKILQDPKPCENLEAYAHEIETDLGWAYSADIVMPMIYLSLVWAGRTSKKVSIVKTYIEKCYHRSIYWRACSSFVPFNHKVKQRKGVQSINELMLILEKQIIPGKGNTPINITLNVKNEIGEVGNLFMDNHGTINTKE